MEFITEIETKYHEYDPQGIVNNIYITSYAQHTYLKFIRQELNGLWGFENVKFVLKENRNIFKEPIPAVDNVCCKLLVSKYRPTGFTAEIIICKKGDPSYVYAVNYSELVHVSLETFRPMIMPQDILEKLKRLMT